MLRKKGIRNMALAPPMEAKLRDKDEDKDEERAEDAAGEAGRRDECEESAGPDKNSSDAERDTEKDEPTEVRPAPGAEPLALDSGVFSRSLMLRVWSLHRSEVHCATVGLH